MVGEWVELQAQPWWRAKTPDTKDTECAECHTLFKRSAPGVKYCGPTCNRIATLALKRARHKANRTPRTTITKSSARMGQMVEPALCACRNNLVRSEWHCPVCSRWKPASALMCARCIERAWWSG